MTEFLVNRSYADKYNLIACAIGHHIYESRWLRNPEYLNQIIHTWYRGNEGGPMAKMTKFSSWNADAVLGRYMVDGNKEFLLDMVKDLEAEYARWEKTNRLPNGLYWQGMCRMVWKNPSAEAVVSNMPVPLSTVICMATPKHSLLSAS
jgi:hypothetical protein